jgi:hypothetical protein
MSVTVVSIFGVLTVLVGHSMDSVFKVGGRIIPITGYLWCWVTAQCVRVRLGLVGGIN